ncbi:MAG: DUF1062 domain-containing protein [Rhizobiaceae bacterium]
MSRALSVRWTIAPKTFPQPWRFCSRCGKAQPFRCGEKFRLNANGKRLDAWLIYKCAVCDDTWNRMIIERRVTRDIDPEMLAAFEANDTGLIRRYAFDAVALRRHAHRVDAFADVEIFKEVLADQPSVQPRLTIELAPILPVPTRLDRLLATELALSRGRIAAMGQAGLLTPAAALRKAVRDRTVITIELATDDAERVFGGAW